MCEIKSRARVAFTRGVSYTVEACAAHSGGVHHTQGGKGYQRRARSRVTPASRYTASSGCVRVWGSGFRGGLVFKAHRLLYHSTLGLIVIKKKKKLPGTPCPAAAWGSGCGVQVAWGSGCGVVGCGVQVVGFRSASGCGVQVARHARFQVHRV